MHLFSKVRLRTVLQTSPKEGNQERSYAWQELVEKGARKVAVALFFPTTDAIVTTVHVRTCPSGPIRPSAGHILKVLL